MWICLNNAFVSIVQPTKGDVPAAERQLNGPDVLMVRARKPAHLKRVFPGFKVHIWPGRDYPARVFVNRDKLASIVASAVIGVNYSNFKNSVRDDELHDAYSAVWGVMHRYQHGSFKPKPRKALTAAQGRLWGYEGGKDGYDPIDWPDSPLPAADLDDEPFPDWTGPAHREPDRYGAFDTGEEADDDSTAQGHGQVPPVGV